jgi:hypothetical protein
MGLLRDRLVRSRNLFHQLRPDREQIATREIENLSDVAGACDFQVMIPIFDPGVKHRTDHGILAYIGIKMP